jgi:glyoxylase-like metal-dependent hydrolase (beta-lactamase superfamily II)
MNPNNYHFKIGSFECLAVSDGTMTYAPPTFPPPYAFLFANADKTQLVRVLIEHGIELTEWKEWVSSYTCLLIDTGKYKVLVDTGAGNLGQNTEKLLQNLKYEGIEPEEIKLVILTHGHPDHIGGNLNTGGKPIFAKARWAMWKDEWLFWTSEQAEKQLDEHSKDILINIARMNLLPLRNMIELVDNEVEIVPGIRAIAAPGHTPGLMALSVTCEGEQLLCISDVIIHPVHLARPEWFAATDVVPDQVIATRRKLLSRAALEKSQVMAFHFPFPGLGYISRRDQGWQWQPVVKIK